MSESKIIGIRGLNEDTFHEWRELVVACEGKGKRRGKFSIVAESLNRLMERDIQARTRTEPNGDPSKPLRVRSKRDLAGLERVKRRTEGTLQMPLGEFNQIIRDSWGVHDDRTVQTLRDLAMIELGAKEHPVNPDLIEFTPTHR